MLSLYREYQYRKITHVTHDQYLEETTESVDWMLGFSDMEAEMKADSAQDAH